MFEDMKYCSSKSAEDPTCVRLTLSGNMITTNDTDDKYIQGKAALFSKHSMMKNWPSNHGWKIYYLNITDIFLLDMYGGAHPITVQDYFKAV